MLCLHISEEQLIGPVEMAQKINFRVRYLMFIGLDQLSF